MTITDVKNHLVGMMHAGSSLNKVRNLYYALERASNNVLANIKPIDSERTASIASLIYDDIYNYPLPSDFGWPIDLLPQGTRNNSDDAARRFARDFDLLKGIRDKTASIESKDGTKVLRLNWRGRAPITIDGMNAVGDWSTVATASNLELQEIYKISGAASLQFDIAVSGDGIQNTALDTIDLSDEDEIADKFVWMYIKNSTDLGNLNSITAVWGNDLDTNYWTSTAVTTQADGSAFKVGWNLVKFTWGDATETGSVSPSTLDSIKYTFDVDAAITNICLDAPVFVVGRAFDIKYYSAYGFKNSGGTYLVRPSSDDDEVIFTGTALQIYLEECRKEIAAQIEGQDSAFDISYAEHRLYGNPGSPDPILRAGLYAKYRSEYPSQVRKPVGSWARPRNPNRR